MFYLVIFQMFSLYLILLFILLLFWNWLVFLCILNVIVLCSLLDNYVSENFADLVILSVLCECLCSWCYFVIFLFFFSHKGNVVFDSPLLQDSVMGSLGGICLLYLLPCMFQKIMKADAQVFSHGKYPQNEVAFSEWITSLSCFHWLLPFKS